MTESKDATETPWIDPDDDDLEWTAEMFDAAEIRHGDVLIRPATGAIGPDGRISKIARGRPKLVQPKRQVTLRLDEAVVEHFRQGGPGWQSRINETLRKATGA